MNLDMLDKVDAPSQFRKVAVPVDYSLWRGELGLYMAYPDWDHAIIAHKRGDYKPIRLLLEHDGKTVSDEEIAGMSSADIISTVIAFEQLLCVLGIERQLEEDIWRDIGKCNMVAYGSDELCRGTEPAMFFARPEYIYSIGAENCGSMISTSLIPEKHLGGDLFRSRVYRLPADLRVVYPDMRTTPLNRLPGYKEFQDEDTRHDFSTWATDEGALAWQFERDVWSYKMCCLAGVSIEFDSDRAGMASVEYDLGELRNEDS